MKSKIFIWFVSVMMAVATMVFQRLTGPTYPLRGEISLADSKISFKLQRTHAGPSDHAIRVEVPADSISGKMRWKRYKTQDEWRDVPMLRESASSRCLVVSLPHQPPAGKLQYLVVLSSGQQSVSLTGDTPVIIRFRGDVPAWWLLPHILFMILAMLLGTRALVEALVRGTRLYAYTLGTTVTLLIGGFVLGPIVQHYAFGVWWSGFPFGHDATDNKTLLSLVAWLLAAWRGKKGNLRAWVIAAFVALVAIYLVPHSVLGSELDYNKLPTSNY